MTASELEQQKQLLAWPVGGAGSGAIRYGAAMALYQAGLMSLELLEIYRRCCKFDSEDPIALAEHEQVRSTLKPMNEGGDLA